MSKRGRNDLAEMDDELDASAPSNKRNKTKGKSTKPKKTKKTKRKHWSDDESDDPLDDVLEGGSDDDGMGGVYGGAPTPAVGLSAPTPGGGEVSLKKRLLSGAGTNPTTPGLAAALGGGSDDEDEPLAGKSGFGSEEEFSGGYNSDLIIDEVDADKVAKMPEVEREMLFVEREERRARWKARREHSRQKRERATAKRSKRDRETEAQGSRKKGTREDALSDLRARKKRAEERKRRRELRGGEESESDDHRRSEEESDEEWGGSSRKRRDKKKRKSSRRSRGHDSESSEDDLSDFVEAEEEDAGQVSKRGAGRGRKSAADEAAQDPAKVGDVNKARLTRNTLERWVGQDHAEKAMPGFFVRVGAGNPTSGPKYVLGRIAAVVDEGVEYQLGNKTTSKVLKVLFGPHELTYQMQYVSNGDATYEEFAKWWHQMHDQSLPSAHRQRTVTVADVNMLVSKFHSVENYYLDPSKLDALIAERAATGDLPTNLVRERAKVLAELTKAQDAGDYAAADRAQAKLQALSDRSSGYKDVQNTKFAATNKINAANRRINLERYYKFTKEQKQKDLANGGGPKTINLINSDPFSRVKSTTTFILPRGADAEETPADKNGADKSKADGADAGDGAENGGKNGGTTKIIVGAGQQSVNLAAIHDVDVDMSDLEISDLDEAAAAAPLPGRG